MACMLWNRHLTISPDNRELTRLPSFGSRKEERPVVGVFHGDLTVQHHAPEEARMGDIYVSMPHRP